MSTPVTFRLSLTRWGRWVAVLLVSVGVLIAPALTAPTASAHNDLESTDPAAGAVLAQVPATVTLTFGQLALGVGSEVVITGPNGQVQAGGPRLVDRTVAEDITAGAPAGQYRVLWRVTSADGHPVSGQFTFVANEPGGGTQPGPTVKGPSQGGSPDSALPTKGGSTASQTPWSVWRALALAVVLVVAAFAVVRLRVRRRRTR
ncbi:copper resistance CopC family protein [Lapillicoccus sp.]|uniref:copper resistance CopC family protein n=1 Tax=Lapillicoccus sp. TaxID=1909287 RepID=UPI0032658BB0